MIPAYPFSAVVGMPDLRMALLLNAVSPAVGGVLVRGEKGTAKSTVVRALAALLPAVDTVAGCRFSCDPASPDAGCPDGPHEGGGPSAHRPARLVELPVGATEDRLVGSLDLQRALTEGVKAYEPGLLAAAHRGVLYVDEVNLLHDHLVDLLLDAAAMGQAYVEREGVSVRHAARFLLVGTMNPEEGELRPQLLDRFGLTVEVRASREPSERAEVVRRRLAYESDPSAFATHWADADAALAAQIAEARGRLAGVGLPDSELLRIARVCAAFEVDGLRADLVVARAAVALAAWRGRTEVGPDEVREAARLALPHRRRRDPFDSPGLDQRALDDALRDDDLPEPPPDPSDSDDDRDPDPDRDPDGGPDNGPPAGPDGGGAPPRNDQQGGDQRGDDQPGTGDPDGSSADAPADPDRDKSPAPAAAPAGAATPPGEPYRTRLLAVRGTGSGDVGRRSPARNGTGRTVAATPPRGRLSALHLSATLHAAAPHQHRRGRTTGALRLHPADLRQAVREGRESNLVLFAVDASGSMAARQRMRAVKGAVLSLLLDAYQRRDKVGVITFRGTDAELTLPPTSSVEAGAARLRELRTGGKTPLAAGLLRAADVLRTERLRDPRRRALLVLVTDGRATAGRRDPLAEALYAANLVEAAGSVVVDCETGPVRLGLAARFATALGGDCVHLEELSADGLAQVARTRRAA
ncbi:MAG: putative cobaltochelatase [Micromonosporaceae bacterium]